VTRIFSFKTETSVQEDGQRKLVARFGVIYGEFNERFGYQLPIHNMGVKHYTNCWVNFWINRVYSLKI